MPLSDKWADHLIFPPWIEDGQGVLYNQAFYDASRRLPDGDGAAPPVDFPFHAAGDSND